MTLLLVHVYQGAAAESVCEMIKLCDESNAELADDIRHLVLGAGRGTVSVQYLPHHQNPSTILQEGMQVSIYLHA